jgi:hypothetical protein
MLKKYANALFARKKATRIVLKIINAEDNKPTLTLLYDHSSQSFYHLFIISKY